MADVKPAEVSAILKEQLSGFRSEAELQKLVLYSKLEMVSHVSMD
jgi:hypothetical protein